MPTHDENSDLELALGIDREPSVVAHNVEVGGPQEDPVPAAFPESLWGSPLAEAAKKKKKGKKGIEISSWN